MTAHRLFKEVLMHIVYVRNCLECKFQKLEHEAIG